MSSSHVGRMICEGAMGMNGLRGFNMSSEVLRNPRRWMHRPFAAMVVGNSLALSLDRVTVPIANLHPSLEGLRIVQLSDLHLYPFTRLEFIAEAVELANSLKPDVTVLTGDYVSHVAAAVHDLEPVLGRLDARFGVHAVLGNHDHWTNAEVVRAGLRRAGLNLLHNQGVPVGSGDEKVWIAGLDDAWAGQADLTAARAGAPAGAPVVLLVHEPDVAEEYSRNKRIALQLSGHTHGGQVRIHQPRRAYTLPRYGRKYDQGLFRVNGMWLYTNRGVGMVVAPIRVNCPAEVTEFTLVAAPPDTGA